MNTQRARRAPVLLLLMLTAVTVSAQFPPPNELRNVATTDLWHEAVGLLPVFVNPGLVQVPLSIHYVRVLADHIAVGLSMDTLSVWNPAFPRSPDSIGTSFSLYPAVQLEWHPFNPLLDGLILGVWAQLRYSASLSVDMRETTPYPAFDQTYELAPAVAATAGYRVAFPFGLVLEALGRLGVSYSSGTVVHGDDVPMQFVNVYLGLTLGVGYGW